MAYSLEPHSTMPSVPGTWLYHFSISACRLRKCALRIYTIPLPLFWMDTWWQKGSSSLRKLIERFSGSLCAEGKDKIYGLTGVVSNGTHLPIDYEKSLFNTFSDIVMLQGSKDSDFVVQFSQLLQRTLGGQARPSDFQRAFQSMPVVPALWYGNWK